MIVAVTNQKGGVGKTTTTANLGVLLARAGRRVLLVDADPQSALTRQMGIAERSLGVNLIDVLAGRAAAQDAIVGGVHGVDVIASGRDLAGIELSLVGELAPAHLEMHMSTWPPTSKPGSGRRNASASLSGLRRPARVRAGFSRARRAWLPDDVDRLAGGGQPCLPLVWGLWPVLDGDERCLADRAATVLGSVEPLGGVVDRQGCFASSPGPVVAKRGVVG